VAPDHLAQRALEHGRVQRAREPGRQGHVVHPRGAPPLLQ
jgi:hypothetical protein